MEEGLDKRKNKTEEDDESALGELRVLMEKLLKLGDEKETIEIMGKNKELEETLLNDELEVAKKENAIIKEMEEGLDKRKNKTEEDDEAALGELRVLMEKLLK